MSQEVQKVFSFEALLKSIMKVYRLKTVKAMKGKENYLQKNENKFFKNFKKILGVTPLKSVIL